MKSRLPPRARIVLQRMPKDSVCAEIGVWTGIFSERILEVVQPKRLYLIDPWLFQPQYTNRAYGTGIKNQEVMTKIHDDVVEKFKDDDRVVVVRKTSEEAAKDFDEEFFDWVYIDGNHSYEFVKQDLELYTPRVKIGGWITGDDYAWGIKEMKGSVRKAVNEFKKDSRVKFVEVKANQFLFRRVE